ncbi:MAG: hypothetical protein KBC21_00230 [Candidatus Pacebacteria bacterium]|nr:hypothetical protein [Candidatus Paceibacterota bacterium]
MSKKPSGTKKSSDNKMPKEVKKTKIVKTKGPRPPSYTPNMKRQQAKAQASIALQFAAMRNDIAAEQIKFPDFVAKVPGQYLVGTLEEIPEYMVLTVKVGGKPGSPSVVIENEGGTYIPHTWIFVKDKEVPNLRLLNGYGGQDQLEMLQLIKKCMGSEIREAKMAYWEANQQKPAIKVTEPVAVAAPVVAEKKKQETAINLPVWRNNVRKITALVTTDCLGYYDLSDEGSKLFVELRPSKGGAGNEFVVREIANGHYLAGELIVDMIVSVTSVSSQAPGLDTQIRGMLAAHGISLRAVKPAANRDRHALVTSGMPNVERATLLMA